MRDAPARRRAALATWIVAAAVLGGACGDRTALDTVSGTSEATPGDGGSAASGPVTCQSLGGLTAAGGASDAAAACGYVEEDATCDGDRYEVRCRCPGTTCTCVKNREAVGTVATSTCSTCTLPGDAWRACGFPAR